jgi:hypothetical protein
VSRCAAHTAAPGRKSVFGLQRTAVLVGKCHCDRVSPNDPLFNQDVPERLSLGARDRQALVELLLGEEPGARQQFAETRAPVFRFMRRVRCRGSQFGLGGRRENL